MAGGKEKERSNIEWYPNDVSKQKREGKREEIEM